MFQGREREVRYTSWQDGGEGNIIFLDRHNVDCGGEYNGAICVIFSYCYTYGFLILKYMCPHATISVSSYYYICVLIPLHFCPQVSITVRSHSFVCFATRKRLGMSLCVSSHYSSMYVSSYYYMCPHTMCLQV